MKKPKIKFDKAQVLEFLVAHVEKAVFGLFILGFLMFCVGAMKHSPYNKVPKDFTDAATRVDGKVTASAFDPATDVPPMPPLPEARAVHDSEWVTHEDWSRPAFDMKKRRPEPKFLALQDVRVATGYGAVFVRSGGAEEKAAAAGAAAPNADGALRGRGQAAGEPDANRSNSPVKGKQWAVITGLVPAASQTKEYRAAFRDANKSDANLDYPHYHSFDVERAEVPVGTAADAELKWILLDRKLAENEEANFSDRAIDVIDAAFSDSVLTRPLFKISGKEHDRAVGHPKIPAGLQTPGTVAPAAPPAKGGLGGRAQAMGAAATHANSSSEGKIAEHLLFRCFDFSVVPGKTYRYRVRLVLDNPNYGLGAQYLANAQLAKGLTRPSPWSEVSSEVTMPLGFSMLAGGIKPSRQINEQKLEVILRMWDSKEAVDASRIVELFRGQVANFPTEEAFVDRADGTGEPKRIAFRTDMMVVDMTGGDTVAMPGGGRARAPSQALVLEPNGKLTVRSELADAETYDSTKQRLKKLQEAAKPPVDKDDDDDKPKSRRKPDQGGGLSGLRAGADSGKAGKKARD
jgi:hypothetical protein